MIKIPENKYYDNKKHKDLITMHYTKIKNYIKDVIQIYINCFSIIEEMNLGKGVITDYSNNVVNIKNTNTYKKIIQVISIGKFSTSTNPTSIITIDDVFIKSNIKDEYINNCKIIKSMLNEFLNPTSKVYIEKIITEIPEKLMDIYIELKTKYRYKSGIEIFIDDGVKKGLKIIELFEMIFDYDKFCKNTTYNKSKKKSEKSGIETFIEDNEKWNAYDFCERLGLKVCPYCNRNYIFTVRKVGEKNKEDITRCQLDHYFPQSKYPIFRLSFYNLIPSCSVCNSSIKGAKELNLDDYVHPYMNGIDKKYKFTYIYKKYKEVEVKIKSSTLGHTDTKTENQIDFFKINEVYRNHDDVVLNLIDKRDHYPESLINEILKLMNNGRHNICTKEELMNHILDRPDGTQIIDTSLGKLKSDIIDELQEIVIP